jgi:hypothetical protein
MGDSPKEIVSGAVEVTATAGAAAIAAMKTMGAVGATALATGPMLLAAGVGVALDWRQRDAARFWHEVVNGKHGDDLTAAEIAGRVEAHMNEPYVRETLLRSVRTVLDAVDPAVVVPLATLARACLRDKTPPDAFTRSTMRLLTELGRDELGDLGRLAQWIMTETKVQAAVTLMAGNHEQVAKGQWVRIPWRVEMQRDEYVGKREGTNDERYAVLVGLKAPDRLFSLLRLNGLASEASGVSFAAGPTTIVIERVTVERLREATRLAI